MAKRQAWAKLLFLAAVLKRNAHGFLALTWPSTEPESAAKECVRRQILVALQALSSGSGGSARHDASIAAPCVQGAPSITLGHLYEAVAGVRLVADGPYWAGISRTSAQEEESQLVKLEATVRSVVVEAKRFCHDLVTSYNETARKTPKTFVFQDETSPHARCFCDDAKILQRFEIVDWGELSAGEKGQRLANLAFAREALRPGAVNQQDEAKLEVDAEFAEKFVKLCSEARAAFHRVTEASTPMLSSLKMCEQQASAELELQRTGTPLSSGPRPAETSVTASTASLNSIVHRAIVLLKTPGSLSCVKQILSWIYHELGDKRPQSKKVLTLENLVTVADALQASHLAVAVPPLTVSAETLAESQKREQDLEAQNADLKSENERLKQEMEALKQENAALRQGNAGTKLLDSADAPIENNPLGAEGSPPSERKERSAASAAVESPLGRSPKRQRTPLRSVDANAATSQ